jgi:hypothetical protein
LLREILEHRIVFQQFLLLVRRQVFVLAQPVTNPGWIVSLSLVGVLLLSLWMRRGLGLGLLPCHRHAQQPRQNINADYVSPDHNRAPWLVLFYIV